MLTSLHIQNLVVVKELEVEFATGLTVLTGETGAGKSILIDALGLALGDRAESHLIRDGEERASVTATFDISAAAEAQEFLRDHALEVEHECLLRRVLNRDGRSRAYCNSTPVALSVIRELAGFLIEIQAQHAAQRTLDREVQRTLLDSYGVNDIDVAAVNDAFREWRQLNDQLRELESQHQDPARLELLRYQLDELMASELNETELEDIEDRYRQSANREKSLETCASLRELLDSSNGIVDRLANAERLAATLAESIPSSNNLYESIVQAQTAGDEAALELARLESELDVDPEALQQLERRLDALFTLARKHQAKVTDLIEVETRIRGEIAEFESGESQREALTEQITLAEKAYTKAAKRLSTSRADAASRMDADVTSRLRQLGMPNAAFMVNLAPRQDRTPHAHGLDQIEFSVATNPSTKPGPIAKVASGGELSRIALAIQAATAEHSGVPVVVYDEVDSGIGGNTANIVGRSLRNVSAHCQAICITHSPQVASAGDHHARIDKRVSGGEAVTELHYLDPAEREFEISRMLGAPDASKSGISHARELLKNARS